MGVSHPLMVVCGHVFTCWHPVFSAALEGSRSGRCDRTIVRRFSALSTWLLGRQRTLASRSLCVALIPAPCSSWIAPGERRARGEVI